MASIKVSAIVLSGGQGTRLQQYGFPKQFIEVAGKPLFVHTMELYEALDEIDEVVLVINEDFRARYDEILDKQQFSKLRAVVPGGKKRHMSIQSGLSAVLHDGVVVIQNGVNPTTPHNIIRQCIETAAQHGASTAYVPASHTVFIGSDDEIDTVLERTNLGYTSDPQAFRADILRAALEMAKHESHRDLPMVELAKRLGHKVKLVVSDEKNLKVSTELDLFTTEIILSRMKANQ